MKHVSKLVPFLLYEVKGANQKPFFRACFTASFDPRDTFSIICFSKEKFIIQIELGPLSHS